MVEFIKIYSRNDKAIIIQNFFKAKIISGERKYIKRSEHLHAII